SEYVSRDGCSREKNKSRQTTPDHARHASGTRRVRVAWSASCIRACIAMGVVVVTAAATQKIFRIRRDYNTWVANETLEDYSLRYTPRAFRKWSEFRVANTAFGATSFLALEAIGGAIALNYGFTNALWAILFVGLITFATGLPISYYAA